MSLAVQVFNPYVDGMTLTGAILQSEFSTLIAKVNNLDNDNIAAAAAIAWTKMAATAWTSYTPAWTGSTSDPVIGNGTITGRYFEFGKNVFYSIQITTGSTTTYGTGQYFVSLPSTSKNDTVEYHSVGHSFDAGGVNRWQITGRIPVNVSRIELYAFSLTGVNGRTTWDALSPSTPFNWVASCGLSISGCYQKA